MIASIQIRKNYKRLVHDSLCLRKKYIITSAQECKVQLITYICNQQTLITAAL
jgi:hypothetical protein